MPKLAGWIKYIGLLSGLVFTTASYADERSLYDRIGGNEVARAVTEDIWNNHSKNPIVNNRFANSDADYVNKKSLKSFLPVRVGLMNIPARIC